MIKLTVEQVPHMHQLMAQKTGGEVGVRDSGLLDMTLHSAFQTFAGEDLYPTTVAKITHLAFSVVKNHPFVDGNKRIGLFVMLVLLNLSDIEIYYSQKELIDLGIGLADGSIDNEMLLAWINQKTK